MICLFAGVALFGASAARGDRVPHATGNLPKDVALPPFNPARAQNVIQNILQEYRASNGNNWRDVESDIEVDSPNRKSRALPFDRAKVDKATEEIARELNERPPKSWEDLSAMMAKYKDVIPDAVVKDVIRDRVNDKAREDLSKEVKEVPGPNGEIRKAERDRPSPTGLQSLEKTQDPNLGKFSGFLGTAKPRAPSAAAPSGAGSGPSSGGSPSAGTPSFPYAFGSNTPSVASSGRPAEPNRAPFPAPERTPSSVASSAVSAKDAPQAVSGTADSAAKTRTRADGVEKGEPSAESPVAGPMGTLLSGVPGKAPVPSPVPVAPGSPLSAFESALQNKAPQFEVPKDLAVIDSEDESEGTEGASPAEGGGLSAASGSDSGDEGPGDGSFWTLVGRWLLASLRALTGGGGPSLVAVANVSVSKAFPEFSASHPAWAELAAILDGSGLTLRPASRDRVLASVAEGTGLSWDNAARLYYAAIACAWLATLVFLAWLGRQYLWPFLVSRLK